MNQESLTDIEKYFRPSRLPVLNDRNFTTELFNNYYGKDGSNINLPEYFFKTPGDTILNYFSVLREAANPIEGKMTGCGTIGYAQLPYSISYNFLSTVYKQLLSYEHYLKMFENILHINLIKLNEVPIFEGPVDTIRYFFEIETIEGSDKGMAYFAYYYGFIDIINENGLYKISDLIFYPQNYLCAPYHGWAYMAELVVDIKYGEWCHLVKEKYPTQQDEYKKYIFFRGTDGNDYIIEFYQLTNGTDIEIAQYMKTEDGSWILVLLDPNKCLHTN